ncbi:hypothetical protein BKA57DRAFT_314461 [Linnemannia elongata]|nr:hypothetical protein BKA57DRAFT_314461 [Linnemannia elongata]
MDYLLSSLSPFLSLALLSINCSFSLSLCRFLLHFEPSFPYRLQTIANKQQTKQTQKGEPWQLDNALSQRSIGKSCDLHQA